MTTVVETAQKSSIPALIPPSFTANQPPTIRLYPLSNYTFGTKETQLEEDQSVQARLKRLQDHYKQHGMRRTCEGALVCHEHNHPHVLMLQIANTFFKLPGDWLGPEAEEIPGLKQILTDRLSPTPGTSLAKEEQQQQQQHQQQQEDQDSQPTSSTTQPPSTDWTISDVLATWWRPNFEIAMYPFLPTHVSRPKECKKIYFIQLPKSKVLSVPKNMKLLAVPLFELYDNAARYGQQLSSIPHTLSRYRFEFVDEAGNVCAVTPGGGPYDGGKGKVGEDDSVPIVKVLAEGSEIGDSVMKAEQ